LQRDRIEKYHEVRHEVIKKFVIKVNDLCKKVLSHEKTWEKRLLPFMGPVLNKLLKDDLLLFMTGLDSKIP